VPAAILAALAVSVGVYAASGRAGAVGLGTSVVSAATVSNLHFRLDAVRPSRIDALTFSVRPALADGHVSVQAAGHPYACRLIHGGAHVVCPTTSPPLTARELTTLAVVAAD
jgi:hypothetical protein